MEKIVKITKENHINVLENLKYGINLVVYESNEVWKLTYCKIKVLNAYFDTPAIEEKEAVDIEQPDGSFLPRMTGVMNIIFRKPNTTIPILHPDNYLGEDVLNSIKESCIVSRHLNIDVRLRKYYRNMALILNIKFKDNRFDGTNRKGKGAKKVGSGVSNQIRESFLNGEKSVFFSSYRTNIQTIRNATTTLSKAMNKKWKVEIHGYEIFVIFRDFTEIEKDDIIFKNHINKMKQSQSKEYIVSKFYKYLELETINEDIFKEEINQNYDEYVENDLDIQDNIQEVDYDDF